MDVSNVSVAINVSITTGDACPGVNRDLAMRVDHARRSYHADDSDLSPYPGP